MKTNEDIATDFFGGVVAGFITVLIGTGVVWVVSNKSFFDNIFWMILVVIAIISMKLAVPAFSAIWKSVSSSARLGAIVGAIISFLVMGFF